MNDTNRLAYLDGASGFSGDMLLGAVIAAGVSSPQLQRSLTRALRVTGWRVNVRRVLRQGLPGVYVHVTGDRAFPSLAGMRRIIARARLPTIVRRQALFAFDHLLRAEQAVHRVGEPSPHTPTPLASLDTLVDLVGGPWGLALLQVQQVWASPLNGGTLAPATLSIVQKARIPIYSEGTPSELVTPTGAALAASVISRFGHLPLMRVETFGCGAGSQDLNDRANLLRLIIGSFDLSAGLGPGSAQDKPRSGQALRLRSGQAPTPTAQLSSVLLLETHMDDMDPRVYPEVMAHVLEAGALDVWLTTVMMKKGRPGMLLSVLLRVEDEAAIAGILFRETTTLGIRRLPLDRWVLPRRVRSVLTPGRLQYKEAFLGPGRTKRSVEYESARALAQRHHRVVREVLQAPLHQ